MIAAVLHDPRWRAAWRLLFLMLIGVVSWLAFSPNPPPAADLGWDKANHFAAFASLTVVALQSLRAGRRRVWIVLLAMLGYGILIEIVQAQIPGRDADVRDVAADMVGAFIGVLLHGALTRLIKGPSGPAR
ncbi:VanZ family protein [Roseateles sp.]|uniref:VanZ family protein n=1 Tax=Roseateles sp. TaxID=1971397 RepID=UPI0031D8F265